MRNLALVQQNVVIIADQSSGVKNKKCGRS